MSTEAQHEIERLNTDCTCITLDLQSLCRAVEQVVGDPTFCRDLAATHPHLLSAQPMFLSAAHAERMQEIIRSIEAVASRPSYQSAVLERAPEIARFQPGPVGVFMGYDFHLGRDGPQLIEINTNAGGALINAFLLQAQRACCGDMAVATAMHFNPSALLAEFMLTSQWSGDGKVEQALSGRSRSSTSHPCGNTFIRNLSCSSTCSRRMALKQSSQRLRIYRIATMRCGAENSASTSFTTGLPISISSFRKARCCERPIWRAR